MTCNVQVRRNVLLLNYTCKILQQKNTKITSLNLGITLVNYSIYNWKFLKVGLSIPVLIAVVYVDLYIP